MTRVCRQCGHERIARLSSTAMLGVWAPMFNFVEPSDGIVIRLGCSNNFLHLKSTR